MSSNGTLVKGSWTAKVQMLPTANIDKDEANRKVLTNMDKLRDDIVRAGGLYYPIQVSPYVRLDGGGLMVGDEALAYWELHNFEERKRRFMIFDGERRFVCCAEWLHWSSIPAIVRLKENYIELLELQLASNAKREDTNPVDMAHAIERYVVIIMAEMDLTRGPALKRVAQLTDWSMTYIEARLDILKMPTSIQQDIQQGITGANVPTEIIHNIPDRWRKKYEDKVAKRQITNVLDARVIGKELKLIERMPDIPEERKKPVGDAVIDRDGRFSFDKMDEKPDWDAYEFEVRSWRERVSCWNIKRVPEESEVEHIRRMERLASHLHPIQEHAETRIID